MATTLDDIHAGLGRIEMRVGGVDSKVDALTDRFEESERARVDAQLAHAERFGRMEAHLEVVRTPTPLPAPSPLATHENGAAPAERAIGRLALKYAPWFLLALLGGKDAVLVARDVMTVPIAVAAPQAPAGTMEAKR